jgi:hypothetical protein
MDGHGGDNARGRVIIVEVMDGVSAGFKRHDGENDGEREGCQSPGRLSPRPRPDPEGVLAHRADHVIEIGANREASLACSAGAVSGARNGLNVGTLASPIRRMETSVGPAGGSLADDDWSQEVALAEHVLLDDLIRSHQERLRDRQPERLGRFEIDDQLELRWLLDGQFSRLSAA